MTLIEMTRTIADECKDNKYTFRRINAAFLAHSKFHLNHAHVSFSIIACPCIFLFLLLRLCNFNGRVVLTLDTLVINWAVSLITNHLETSQAINVSGHWIVTFKHFRPSDQV